VNLNAAGAVLSSVELADKHYARFTMTGDMAELDAEGIAELRHRSGRTMHDLACVLLFRFERDKLFSISFQLQMHYGPDLSEKVSKLISMKLFLFHPDLSHSIILQIHCGTDLSKKVNKLISMKPFLSIDKLSSSIFHLIPMHPTCAIVWQVHWLPYLVRKLILMNKLLISDFHPIPIDLTRSIILQLHCRLDLRKKSQQVKHFPSIE
jgi:hypothetical protein